MKKANFFYGVFVLCFIIVLSTPLQSMAKVDPIGIYLDEKGGPLDYGISALEWEFLNIKVNMIMNTPNFPGFDIFYDQRGFYGEQMEKHASLHTRGKIVVNIRDTREFYSSLATESELLGYLNGFLAQLGVNLFGITNDIDNDVVIYIIPKEGLEKGGLLGYFYKGDFTILKDFT